MVAEDALLPVSALQHLLFCPRQCALIHVERVWADNDLTVEGSFLHQKVDETGPRSESRGNVRIARGLALRSLRLGLVGRADVVEFHRVAESEDASSPARGTELPGAAGRWRPYPVEHKRGRPKRDLSDKVQLCAQALCLGEMLDTEIPEGALYYGSRRRRLTVEFDSQLRSATERSAAELHRLVALGVTPRAEREPRCKRCSLLEICLPEAMSAKRSARDYLRQTLRDATGAEPGT